METGIARGRLRAGVAAALLAAGPALAACGGGGGTGAFGWLRPAPPPGNWQRMRIPSGATLPYPPGWTPLKGDVGTASAALTGPDRRIVGYLNLTPRQGGETLGNWASFRVHHNAEEGDRSVIRLASAAGLRFRTGRGACVRDSYHTVTGNRYIELACLVQGRRARTVVVAAATSAAWSRIAPLLERALSSLTT
jgi:hypothetical protein